jgi:hypothetical protein
MDQQEMEARLKALEDKAKPWLAKRWEEARAMPATALLCVALGALAAAIARLFLG